ncbi:MAG: MBL fold metallo-hydrolase [Eubacterium sp.]|jgi:phosphoribosyl 1,2-cyclic phosphodiesterase|nr:MBL fold metallo-hydrolase [Eubacterium sp.]
MAKIIPLCSSSKGNSVLVCLGKTNILIDIGCSFRILNTYLKYFNYSILDISAVLITHEHTDHVYGLNTLIKNTNIPVFATEGTTNGIIEKSMIEPELRCYIHNDIKEIELDTEIKYFKTSHDTYDSVGYVINSGINGCSFAYCTDLGEVTREVRTAVLGSDVVFLESNYCRNRLDQNPRYPNFLKKRIKSSSGHLSNRQSAEFAAELVKNGTKRIILGHLSQENNTPDLAYQCNAETLYNNNIKNGVDYILNVAGPVNEGWFAAV